MIKYQKIFFKKMKSLLPYFVEFFENGRMVLKEYVDDYAIRGPD